MDEPLILDRYRLVERIALGGTAEVWRAHDEQLDRQVAVKRLHPHLMPDEGSRRRLAAEARAAAGLSHPVLVDVYDIDTEGESPAIVMELVDGESLATRIARDGALGPAEAGRITADVADALYHAHQRGLVHRDVKPGNVLLSADGRTRLVDFGIARSLAESAERFTQAGTVMGTLSAMAPEQLAGGPIGPRTDLYGLGVVLHEALTGRPPYAAGTPVALADAQRAGPPSLAGIDPTLAALVAACLAPRPEDRPLHAGALAQALRAWIAGDPSPARVMAPTAAHAAVDTAAVTQPLAIPAATAAPPPSNVPTRAARPSRRALLIGLGAALLAVGVAVAIVSLDGLPAAAEEEQSATPILSPVVETPPVELAGWARKLQEDYEEDCGTRFDPALIAGMNKQEAESTVDSLREACEEADD
ncbi:MAG: serine/threonine-protein kinase [Candidatus Limnocylindria bacterium]